MPKSREIMGTLKACPTSPVTACRLPGLNTLAQDRDYLVDVLVIHSSLFDLFGFVAVVGYLAIVPDEESLVLKAAVGKFDKSAAFVGF